MLLLVRQVVVAVGHSLTGVAGEAVLLFADEVEIAVLETEHVFRVIVVPGAGAGKERQADDERAAGSYLQAMLYRGILVVVSRQHVVVLSPQAVAATLLAEVDGQQGLGTFVGLVLLTVNILFRTFLAGRLSRNNQVGQPVLV